MAKKGVLILSLFLILGLTMPAHAVIRYISIHPSAFQIDPSGITYVTETALNGEGNGWTPVYLPDNATILSVSVYGNKMGDHLTGSVTATLYRINMATLTKEELFRATLPSGYSTAYQTGEDTTLNSGSALVDNNNYWYYLKAHYGQARPGGAYFYGAKIKYQTLF
jgi:hypothetical protein